MKQILKQTTESFATTITEAENIVIEAKSKYAASVINHSITRKVKKKQGDEVEYFLIKIVVSHVTVNELLEDLI